MADSNPPDYDTLKALDLQEKQLRPQEAQGLQKTTLEELTRQCHDQLSRPLRSEILSSSTTGTIPLPTGKYCPIRLDYWADCHAQQQALYSSVYRHLRLTSGNARLFPPPIELEIMRRKLSDRPISSEQGLERYEHLGVEQYVSDIITELSKLPAARDEFGLGDGIQFENHINFLHENEAIETDANQSSKVHNPRPDRFCIHRIDGNNLTLLTTVEYKPPYKLSVPTIRTGLCPMYLWADMVKSSKIPTEEDAKSRYNAERLVCSALVQEYHVMIQEGLEYSYITNEIARVLLRVQHDDPSTLYYYFCDPNSEVDSGADHCFHSPKTSIARKLCLCLMAFRSSIRGQE